MIYLILINAAGCILMLLDKQFAIHKQRRIPEATLFSVATIGGSIGIWSGMYLFRHKTRKPYFKFGIPLIIVAQLALYCFSTGNIPFPTR